MNVYERPWADEVSADQTARDLVSAESDADQAAEEDPR